MMVKCRAGAVVHWMAAFVALGGNMENANEYRDGWPRIPGFYDCLVDGEEIKLKFYVCQVACKPHWIDGQGNYYETMYKVKWKPNK